VTVRLVEAELVGVAEWVADLNKAPKHHSTTGLP
jgi:hypothetical protein